MSIPPRCGRFVHATAGPRGFNGNATAAKRRVAFLRRRADSGVEFEVPSLGETEEP